MPSATLGELLRSELENREESVMDIEEIGIEPMYSRGNGREWVSIKELDEYEGSTGYGSESFPNVIAWTENRVYFKQCYDGAESITSVPRNPSDEPLPGMIGGG